MANWVLGGGGRAALEAQVTGLVGLSAGKRVSEAMVEEDGVRGMTVASLLGSGLSRISSSMLTLL
jgi:hypothetical protein